MTRQVRTPIPRYRAFKGPLLLSEGYRPFFLLAAIWAPLAILLLVASLAGSLALPSGLDVVTWHYHEMLFGFVTAAAAGFALTAVPNWTGRLPLQGLPLLSLLLLWGAGRLAMATSGVIGLWAAAFVDLAFLLVLAFVVLREIIAGRAWGNAPVAIAITLLAAANALFHVEATGLAEERGLAARLGVAVASCLLATIGGRIIPSFTRNWLVKRGSRRLPARYGPIDRLALVALLLFFGLWTFAPEADYLSLLAAVAAALNLVRLLRWRGARAYREPLLWALHLGYLWIPAGLALLVLARGFAMLPESAALHGLTAGAMATMVLAVMSRTVLGRRDRGPWLSWGLAAAFLMVTLAALLRIAATFGAGLSLQLLVAAGIAWIGAFLTFLALCGPVLAARRPVAA